MSGGVGVEEWTEGSRPVHVHIGGTIEQTLKLRNQDVGFA